MYSNGRSIPVVCIQLTPLNLSGRSIVVVRKAGGLVAGVRFSPPRQELNIIKLNINQIIHGK